MIIDLNIIINNSSEKSTTKVKQKFVDKSEKLRNVYNMVY
jgi:hypothetical protein